MIANHDICEHQLIKVCTNLVKSQSGNRLWKLAKRSCKEYSADLRDHRVLEDIQVASLQTKLHQ